MFFPLITTLKKYSLAQFKADFRAALNVSVLDFPQGMAYALLAGFPVIYGLYASAVACIIGPLLASSRFIILGPTNSTAVLLLSSFLALNLSPEERIYALPVLVLLVGVFLVIASLSRIASLIKYISRTVVTGYISAAALLIVVNQLSSIVGSPAVHASTFFEAFSSNVGQWKQVQGEPVLIAALTLFIFFCAKRFFSALPTVALTLLTVSFAVYLLGFFNITCEMLEAVPFGNIPFTLPRLTFDRVSYLGETAMAIAFLAILESTSIAKTLAAKTGARVDLNQQLLSMGTCNFVAAFMSGLPISGSLTRSVLNHSSGAKTAISSIFNGLLVLLAVLLLGPMIAFIPKPALAMIVVIVGCSLINFHQMKVVTHCTRSDAIVFFITFFSGLLFPLHTAIYFGAASSIVLFLRKVSEPQLVEYAFDDTGELAEKNHIKKDSTPEISIVHVEGELFFASTEIFLDQMRLICESPNLKTIIIRVRNAHTLDATSAMAISDLVRFAKEKGRSLIISGGNKQVEYALRVSGTMDLLGEENFFRYVPHNPNISTRNALMRAQKIIGRESAKVLLYTSPNSKSSKPQPAELNN